MADPGNGLEEHDRKWRGGRAIAIPVAVLLPLFPEVPGQEKALRSCNQRAFGFLPNVTGRRQNSRLFQRMVRPTGPRRRLVARYASSTQAHSSGRVVAGSMMSTTPKRSAVRSGDEIAW